MCVYLVDQFLFAFSKHFIIKSVSFVSHLIGIMGTLVLLLANYGIMINYY